MHKDKLWNLQLLVAMWRPRSWPYKQFKVWGCAIDCWKMCFVLNEKYLLIQLWNSSKSWTSVWRRAKSRCKLGEGIQRRKILEEEEYHLWLLNSQKCHHASYWIVCWLMPLYYEKLSIWFTLFMIILWEICQKWRLKLIRLKIGAM